MNADMTRHEVTQTHETGATNGLRIAETMDLPGGDGPVDASSMFQAGGKERHPAGTGDHADL